jgi:hypothetical protein
MSLSFLVCTFSFAIILTPFFISGVKDIYTKLITPSSSIAGYFLSLGFGITSILENQFPIDIPFANQFIPIEINLSSLNIREIQHLGFIVTEDFEEPVDVKIDKIDILVDGHKTYTMRYKKATYTLSPSLQKANIEFGSIPKRLENYIENLISDAGDLRATQEVLPSGNR